MTATPIPRTLLLTQWGEMDVSRLTEKPAGRQPIRTTLHSLGTMPTVLEGIARKLDEGAQVYWVCPLVAESEALDVAAAEERFVELQHAVRRPRRPGARPADAGGARCGAGRASPPERSGCWWRRR